MRIGNKQILTLSALEAREDRGEFDRPMKGQRGRLYSLELRGLIVSAMKETTFGKRSRWVLSDTGRAVLANLREGAK